MKNSPHRQKHQMKKAIRGASKGEEKNSLGDRLRSVAIFNPLKQNPLLPFDKEDTKRILNIYKKNLEIAIFSRVHKHSKFSIRQLESNRPFIHSNETDAKAEKRWMQHDLAKSNDLARKVLKIQNRPHRKAA